MAVLDYYINGNSVYHRLQCMETCPGAYVRHVLEPTLTGYSLQLMARCVRLHEVYIHQFY